jgi:hypothetical protein
MSEHDTQSAIIDLIRIRGGVATRINSGSMIAKSCDRAYRVNLADKGTSDIIALYKGVYLSIEVKYGKGKPTPEQLSFLDNVAKAGGVGLLAYDVDAINYILDTLDIGRNGMAIGNFQLFNKKNTQNHVYYKYL